eukprot:Amastigsp_a676320_1615.p2 type:complete len:148 gc:universal Amastigsp_a676320_1615:1-444(+)
MGIQSASCAPLFGAALAVRVGESGCRPLHWSLGTRRRMGHLFDRHLSGRRGHPKAACAIKEPYLDHFLRGGGDLRHHHVNHFPAKAWAHQDCSARSHRLLWWLRHLWRWAFGRSREFDVRCLCRPRGLELRARRRGRAVDVRQDSGH